MDRPTVLERAFELARSGRFDRVDHIKKALTAENYTLDEVDQLTGRTLFLQLTQLMNGKTQAGSVVTPTSAQLKLARELLGWTRAGVAKRIGVSENSISHAERNGKRSRRMLDRLVALYTAAGVEFTSGNAPCGKGEPTTSGGRGVQLPSEKP
jgi:DNA-binding XRE family transcriptional regulator